MFYLAGYNASDCDATCNGLEVVDESIHQLTGAWYAGSGMMGGIGEFYSEVRFFSDQVAFTSDRNTTYRAEVADRAGRVVRRI